MGHFSKFLDQELIS